MIAFIKSLYNVEISSFDDPMEGHRVSLLNKLAILSLIVCFALTIMTISQGLYPQYLFTLVGLLLFLAVLYLNQKQHYELAKNLYLSFCLLILIVSSITAYQAGRFNDVENIMVGFIATGIFLYSGRMKNIVCLFMFLLLLGLKTIKEYYGTSSFDLNFYLAVQNVSILTFLVVVFASAFRESLIRAFNDIHKQEKILYSLIDNVPLFMAMVDNEKRYAMVNDNYVVAFGKPRKKIIGAEMSKVLPQNILETHSVFVDRALAGESPEFMEETLMPDGSIFYANGRYVPIRGSNGRIESVTVYASDVTKLEKAKVELNKVNKTKDQLFSLIAHDILSPLNLFQSILNISKDESITQEQFFHYQESVSSQLAVLRETIAGLLDWARMQLDGINSVPRYIDVDALLRENLQLYQPMVDKKGIVFSVQSENDLKAWMDENHFKVVVRNLVHNALKYTEKDGRVSIETIEGKDDILLRISDSGIGMDETLVRSILKKEIQNSEPGTGDEMGTGLGLSLSLGLLEKNNCIVTVTSERETGTSFEIRIPKHDLKSKGAEHTEINA